MINTSNPSPKQKQKIIKNLKLFNFTKNVLNYKDLLNEHNFSRHVQNLNFPPKIKVY